MTMTTYNAPCHILGNFAEKTRIEDEQQTINEQLFMDFISKLMNKDTGADIYRRAFKQYPDEFMDLPFHPCTQCHYSLFDCICKEHSQVKAILDMMIEEPDTMALAMSQAFHALYVNIQNELTMCMDCGFHSCKERPRLLKTRKEMVDEIASRTFRVSRKHLLYTGINCDRCMEDQIECTCNHDYTAHFDELLPDQSVYCYRCKTYDYICKCERAYVPDIEEKLHGFFCYECYSYDDFCDCDSLRTCPTWNVPLDDIIDFDWELPEVEDDVSSTHSQTIREIASNLILYVAKTRSELFDDIAQAFRDEMHQGIAPADLSDVLVAEPQGGIYNDLGEIAKTISEMPRTDERDEWFKLFMSFRGSLDGVVGQAKESTVKIDENIQRMTEILENTMPGLSERTEWKELLKEFTKTANNFTGEGLKKTVETNLISKSGSIFAGLINKYAVIATIISLAIYSFKSCSWEYAPLIIVLSGLFVWLFGGGEVWNHLKEIGTRAYHNYNKSKEEDDDVAEVQSGDEIITLCTSIISGLGSFESKKGIKTEIYEKLSNFSRVKSSISDIFTGMMGLMEWVVNLIREYAFDLPAYRFFSANNVAMDTFIGKIDQVLELQRQRKFSVDEDNYRYLLSLEKEAVVILSNMPRGPRSDNMIACFNKEVDKIRTIVNKFRRENPDLKGSRVETVAALFKGSPGMGKSIAMQHLTHAVLAATLTEAQIKTYKESPQTFIYNRQFETGFWDGYNDNAKVVNIDDIGQSKDVPGTPGNDFMALIRAVNCAEYLLDMSGLPDKGVTYFTSPFLFATTNMRKLESDSLHDNKALQRRIIVDYIVCVKDEYCTDDTKGNDVWNRKKDIDKLPIDEDGVTLFNPDHLDFYKSDLKGNPIGSAVTFDHVVKMTLAAHYERIQWYNGHKGEFSRVAEKYFSLNKNIAQPQSGSEPWEEDIILPREDGHTFPIEGHETVRFVPRRNTPSWYTRIMNGWSFDVFEKEDDGSIFLSNWCLLGLGLRTGIMSFIFGVGISVVTHTMAYVVFKVMYLTGMISEPVSFFPQKEIDSEPNSFAFGAKMKGGTKVTTKNIQQYMTQLRAQPQAGDPSGIQVMGKVQSRSIWTIELELPDGWLLEGCALGLKGHFILFPLHYVKSFIWYINLDPAYLDAKVRFTLGKNCFQYMTVKEFLTATKYDKLGELDQAIVKTPDDFPNSKDITGFLATAEDHDLFEGTVDMMLPTKRNNVVYCARASRYGSVLTVSNEKVEAYHLNMTYRYTAPTEKGDCGAPMFVMNTKLQNRKIFGMHVAGHSDRGIGFASFIFAELIGDQLTEFEKDFVQTSIDPMIDFYDESVEPQNGMDYIGSMKLAPSNSGAIDITRSALHNKFSESVAAVAQIKPKEIDGVWISPMALARMKYCLPPVMLDRPRFVYLAEQMFYDMFYSQFNVIKPRLYTLKEALHGLEQSPYFRPIKSSTSSGYPLSLPGRRDDKKEYFKDPTGFYPEVERIINEHIAHMKNGVRLVWIYSDKLKVEKRPLEKVEALSTRMFSAVPFYLLLLMRMYYGSFISWVTANASEFGFAAGVNPYGRDWQKIVMDLAKWSDYRNLTSILVGAGDYAKFDGSALAALLQKVYLIIEMYYATETQDEEAIQIRKLLWLEITNSLHINEGNLYYWTGSMASGNPMTFIINCMIDCLCFRFAWSEVEPGEPFKDNVVLKVGGDDNIFSVNPKFRNTFNELVLPGLMKRIGYTYTTELKSTASVPFRSLNEVEFLKRTFRKSNYDGTIVAPLRYEVCLEIPMWTIKNDKGDKVIADNVITSLREISLWFDNGSVFESSRAKADYERLISMFMIEYPGVFPEGHSLLLPIYKRKQEVQELDFVIPQGGETINPFTINENMTTNNNQDFIKTIPSDVAAPATMETTLENAPVLSQATTQFVDDADVSSSTINYPTTIARDLYTTSTTNYVQDLKTFLAKPIVLLSNSFGVMDSVSTFADLPMPATFLANTMIQNKLLGFFGLRATMNFKLVVNATRFQQGRYIMAFIHTGGVSTSTSPTAAASVNFHKNTIVARTQLPHVELDLNCDTTVVLSIPYLSALNHYPLQTIGNVGDVGYLHLSPYSSLQAGSGSVNAGFTIYGYLTDVELVGVAAPQSGFSEEEHTSMGKVTSVLSKLKLVTDSLGNLPSVASYAKPASWVLDVSRNATKALGWSKPFTEDGTRRVIRDAGFGLCNTDVVDMSKKQTLFSNNSVGVLPGFSGTDVDELALSHLATRSANLISFAWVNASPTGTLIWANNVSPRDVVQSRLILGGNSVNDYTPLQFVSTYFTYWRGAITYRFKFVKTEFHSGRLAICFFPNETATSVTTFSYLNSEYVHRAIIDIRECNEYTVTVPFMSSTPYKSTTGSTFNTGVIALYVVDPVQAPSTVTSAVTILIEHAGGQDIEFAIPAVNYQLPVYNATPQGGDIVNECTLGDVMLGGSSIKENSAINGEACIGERILSFRSMLKAYNLMPWTGSFTPQQFLNVRPFSVPTYYNSLTNPYPAVMPDLYGVLSSIFLFSRGGIRLKVQFDSSNADNNNPMVCYSYYPAVGSAAANSFASVDTTQANTTFSGGAQVSTPRYAIAQTYHVTRQNYFAEVELPQSHFLHSRINSEHTVNQNLPYTFDATRFTTRLVVTFNEAIGSDTMGSYTGIYRAMADDGNFGRFISIGPMAGLGASRVY